MPTPYLSPWSVGREVENVSYYVSQLSDSWQGKIVFSTFLTLMTELGSYVSTSFKGAVHSFSVAFGADAFLLFLLFVMMFFDLLLGLIWAFYKKKFSRAVFVRGVSKCPLYCLYVFLVGAIGAGVSRSINADISVLNFFTAYLVASEAFSVIKNLERLGVKIPPLLLFVVNGFRDKVEKTLHDGFKVAQDLPSVLPVQVPDKVKQENTPTKENDDGIY